MQKKVKMSQSTLYTGFLLTTTINALNTVNTVRIQNNICVMVIPLAPKGESMENSASGKLILV